MFKKSIRYIKISSSPVAFEKSKIKLETSIKKKDKQIKTLTEKIEAARNQNLNLKNNLNNKIELLRNKNSKLLIRINILKKQQEKLCICIKENEEQLEILKNQYQKNGKIINNKLSSKKIDAINYNYTDSINKFYSSDENLDKYYSDLQLSVYEMFLDILADNVKILKDSKVLDVACGLGILTKLAKERFGVHDIHGFDFSDKAIGHARLNNKGIDFFMHNIYDNLAGQYDIIICTETLEHLTDSEAAIHNLISSLTSKGTLFLTVPDGRTDISNKHINFWSPEGWRFFLKKFNHNNLEINTGLIQYPAKMSLRYNWAILRLI